MTSIPDSSPPRLSEKMRDTLATFAVESELERHAVGRQAVSLYFEDGTVAHRSARATLYTLVERGYLETFTNRRNTTAYRLTQKGKDLLNDF